MYALYARCPHTLPHSFCRGLTLIFEFCDLSNRECKCLMNWKSFLIKVARCFSIDLLIIIFPRHVLFRVALCLACVVFLWCVLLCSIDYILLVDFHVEFSCILALYVCRTNSCHHCVLRSNFTHCWFLIWCCFHYIKFIRSPMFVLISWLSLILIIGFVLLTMILMLFCSQFVFLNWCICSLSVLMWFCCWALKTIFL